MKINKPKISNTIEKTILEAVEQNDFNNYYFNNSSFSNK